MHQKNPRKVENKAKYVTIYHHKVGYVTRHIIPEEIMLDRFQEYLEKNGSIGTKQIPYYIKWVKDCYAVLGCSAENTISQEQRKQHLEH
jgi:hypothetical protein